MFHFIGTVPSYHSKIIPSKYPHENLNCDFITIMIFKRLFCGVGKMDDF